MEWQYKLQKSIRSILNFRAITREAKLCLLPAVLALGKTKAKQTFFSFFHVSSPNHMPANIGIYSNVNKSKLLCGLGSLVSNLWSSWFMLCKKVQNFKTHPTPIDGLRMFSCEIQSIFSTYVWITSALLGQMSTGSCKIFFSLSSSITWPSWGQNIFFLLLLLLETSPTLTAIEEKSHTWKFRKILISGYQSLVEAFQRDRI